jgi:hypothetical protein
MYSSYSFTTSALDRGEWSVSRPGRALPPGKGPPVPILQEAGWAPEPVWTQMLEEKYFAPAGDRTPVVQPVVRHYTAWANPAPSIGLLQSVNMSSCGSDLLHPHVVCQCNVNVEFGVDHQNFIQEWR